MCILTCDLHIQSLFLLNNNNNNFYGTITQPCHYEGEWNIIGKSQCTLGPNSTLYDHGGWAEKLVELFFGKQSNGCFLGGKAIQWLNLLGLTEIQCRPAGQATNQAMDRDWRIPRQPFWNLRALFWSSVINGWACYDAWVKRSWFLGEFWLALWYG